MRLVLATRNDHKLRELAQLMRPIELDPLPDEVTLPPEIGTTFADNALGKARAAAAATGLPAIADDSGIEAAARARAQPQTPLQRRKRNRGRCHDGRLAAAGVPRRDDINEALGVGHGDRHYTNVEVKYTAPDGVTVDVSESGWVGTSGFSPKA